jgi:hypothetical protein
VASGAFLAPRHQFGAVMFRAAQPLVGRLPWIKQHDGLGRNLQSLEGGAVDAGPGGAMISAAAAQPVDIDRDPMCTINLPYCFTLARGSYNRR